jgi:hypothetical protein
MAFSHASNTPKQYHQFPKAAPLSWQGNRGGKEKPPGLCFGHVQIPSFYAYISDRKMRRGGNT